MTAVFSRAALWQFTPTPSVAETTVSQRGRICSKQPTCAPSKFRLISRAAWPEAMHVLSVACCWVDLASKPYINIIHTSPMRMSL